jgi:hypothetical protein
VGDVVLFYTGQGIGHVAIVYSVSGGVVTSIGGNEDWTHVGLRHFTWQVGSKSPAFTGSTDNYTVAG